MKMRVLLKSGKTKFSPASTSDDREVVERIDKSSNVANRSETLFDSSADGELNCLASKSSHHPEEQKFQLLPRDALDCSSNTNITTRNVSEDTGYENSYRSCHVQDSQRKSAYSSTECFSDARSTYGNAWRTDAFGHTNSAFRKFTRHKPLSHNIPDDSDVSPFGHFTAIGDNTETMVPDAPQCELCADDYKLVGDSRLNATPCNVSSRFTCCSSPCTCCRNCCSVNSRSEKMISETNRQRCLINEPEVVSMEFFSRRNSLEGHCAIPKTVSHACQKKGMCETNCCSVNRHIIESKKIGNLSRYSMNAESGTEMPNLKSYSNYPVSQLRCALSKSTPRHPFRQASASTSRNSFDCCIDECSNCCNLSCTASSSQSSSSCTNRSEDNGLRNFQPKHVNACNQNNTFCNTNMYHLSSDSRYKHPFEKSIASTDATKNNICSSDCCSSRRRTNQSLPISGLKRIFGDGDASHLKRKRYFLNISDDMSPSPALMRNSTLDFQNSPCISKNDTVLGNHRNIPLDLDNVSKLSRAPSVHPNSISLRTSLRINPDATLDEGNANTNSGSISQTKRDSSSTIDFPWLQKMNIRYTPSEDEKCITSSSENSTCVTGNKTDESPPISSHRNPKCARCRNHKKSVDVKGHKRFCEFQNCTCEKCLVIVERQKIMAKQLALRRVLEQERLLGRNKLPTTDEDVIVVEDDCEKNQIVDNPGHYTDSQ